MASTALIASQNKVSITVVYVSGYIPNHSDLKKVDRYLDNATHY